MTKKGLKLFPNDRNGALGLMLPLVLLPVEVDAVMQEGCCKRDTVGTLGSDDGKVVLTLLIEVIAFYVGLTTIDVR